MRYNIRLVESIVPLNRGQFGGSGNAMATKNNLHRETLKAALRVIQTAETLDQARIPTGSHVEYFRQARESGHQGRCGGP